MDASPSAKEAADATAPPRFVVGSTMRHVLVMTGTGAAGLVAIFIVDLVSLLYISWLNDPSLTAGVGLATVVMFFTISINVGLMIPIGALVSRALGARRPDDARRLATSCSILMAAVAALVSVILLPLLPLILTTIGAHDDTYRVAQSFLWITLPTNVIMAFGMAFSTVLRAAGDAKRSMYATMSVAAVTVVLDPILIFGFGLKANGAAVTINIARVAYLYVGYRYLTRAHDLLVKPNLPSILKDARPFFAIAVPAILTNIAAPVANAFFTGVMAQFGDQAIAASAIIDRVTPVAFAGVFALAGAIGPVLGQNWGAQRYDRMKQTLKDALVFTIFYVGGVWLVALPRAGPADDCLQRAAGHGRDRPVLLPAQRLHLVLHQPRLRGECLVQQPWLSPALDLLQLGPRDAGHDPLRLFRRADRRAQGSPAWDRGRIRGVRHRSRDHGVLDNPAH